MHWEYTQGKSLTLDTLSPNQVLFCQYHTLVFMQLFSFVAIPSFKHHPPFAASTLLLKQDAFTTFWSDLDPTGEDGLPAWENYLLSPFLLSQCFISFLGIL